MVEKITLQTITSEEACKGGTSLEINEPNKMALTPLIYFKNIVRIIWEDTIERNSGIWSINFYVGGFQERNLILFA